MRRGCRKCCLMKSAASSAGTSRVRAAAGRSIRTAVGKSKFIPNGALLQRAEAICVITVSAF